MKTKMSNYRNCFALAYVLLVAVFFVGCTYKHDGEIVKDTKGNLYKLEGNGRTSEAYRLVKIDTVNYSNKFK